MEREKPGLSSQPSTAARVATGKISLRTAPRSQPRWKSREKIKW